MSKVWSFLIVFLLWSLGEVLPVVQLVQPVAAQATAKAKKKTAKKKVAKAVKAKQKKEKKKTKKEKVKKAKKLTKAERRAEARKQQKEKKNRRKKLAVKPEPQIILESVPVKLLEYTVFTLYSPQGSGAAAFRSRLITERLHQLLLTFGEQTIEAESSTGPGNTAQVLINNESLVTLTQYEILGNGKPEASVLARQWVRNLREILNKPKVQDAYFTYAGLPPMVTLEGNDYQLNRKIAQDYGNFTTDGTQQKERVIFWRDGEPKPNQTVYLLNRNRHFVPYTIVPP